MSYQPTYAAAPGPRASSFLAFKDVPKPPRPDGIPFPSTYDTFMDFRFPLFFGIAYFIVAKTLSHYQNGKNRIKGPYWDLAVVAHNVFLAVYSAWTFVGTAPMILGAFWRGYMTDGVAGLTHAFCDTQLSVWGSDTFPRYTYLFYISKYYEIVDTAILLLKGKKVGMLQSYHHTGAIWTMFAGYRAQAMPIWLFCVFNSGVHTIMYNYYAITALKLPFPAFIKRNITRLQISQFLVGITLASSYLWIKLPDLPSLDSLDLASSLPSFPASMDDAAAQFHAAVDSAAAELHLAASALRGEAAAQFQSARLDAVSSFQNAADAAALQLKLATTSLEASMGTLKREGAQCLVNAAQRSAVWLNVAYLIPLTLLFIAFFIETYRKGNKVKAQKKQQ